MRNPTDVPAQAAAFADAHGMLPPGSAVLCALSGGTDSMALLTVLTALSRTRDLTVLAAHYNHQLRGEESQRDEAFVTDWCRKQNIPLTVGRGDVAAQAARNGTGIEETARAMRYAFLAQTARETGADRIATAHNADDNAETLLLHLVRGTGLDGLTGIPPTRDGLIRPLLSCSREELEAYLAAEGVPHVEDSSNHDAAYARNRLRRDVMPVLRDLNPRFSKTLAANLPHLRADRDYLDGAARAVSDTARAEGTGLSLRAAGVAALPGPVAVRAIKQVLARLGRHQIAAVHLDGVRALAAGSDPAARLSLPHGLQVRRVYDKLVFAPAEDASPGFAPVSCPGPGTFVLDNGWTVQIEDVLCPPSPLQGAYTWYLERADFPLLLRPRRTGDRLHLPGRPAKTLKKWYIDEKIPRPLRDALPVLADGSGLLAAAGLGPQADRTAQPGSPALRFTILSPTQQTQRERI